MDEQTATTTKAPPRTNGRFLVAAICVVFAAYLFNRLLVPHKVTLGATVDVTELDSGFTLKARVDTGASISSLHCRTIEIAGAAEEPPQNSGKKVRFLLENRKGDTKWIESTILGFSGVRNASGTTARYRVRLRLLCEGIEKETLVALNDRSEMKYPLLLGRDFLEDEFVVDVSRDNPDYP